MTSYNYVYDLNITIFMTLLFEKKVKKHENLLNVHKSLDSWMWIWKRKLLENMRERTGEGITGAERVQEVCRNRETLAWELLLLSKVTEHSKFQNLPDSLSYLRRS